MITSKASAAVVGIALLIAIGAVSGRTAGAAGPPPIDLGTAANFSVLAGTPHVTNTGPTTTDRSVGIHPAAAVIGFTGAPNGTVGGTIEAGTPVALQAKNDLDAAHLIAAAAPVTATYAALGGRTLIGGVYNSGGATLDVTGVLTLDAQFDPSSVWIFQATSDLITASSSHVAFINGASPCNVFWQVTSSATLGSGSTFVGTILASTSITVNNGVTVYGRALAGTGLVSLINDRFLTLACAGGASVPVPPTMPPFTIAPTATATAAPTATPIGTPAATATPIGGATPAVAPTATPGGAATPLVATVLSLPSTSTDDPVNPLLMLGIALAGIVILVLRRQIRQS
jgi:type VI secretion system secreted protein VgrG